MECIYCNSEIKRNIWQRKTAFHEVIQKHIMECSKRHMNTVVRQHVEWYIGEELKNYMKRRSDKSRREQPFDGRAPDRRKS